MAVFRLRKDARKWFQPIRKGFSVDFDTFYFCFVSGMVSRKKRDIAVTDTAELVDYFPDRYRDRGKILIALFLHKELEELGITIKEKKIVHEAIAKLVSPEAPNFLSDEGVREFNKYAHGGFETIVDWFEDCPRTLHTFLRVFKQKTDTSMKRYL